MILGSRGLIVATKTFEIGIWIVFFGAFFKLEAWSLQLTLS